MNPNQIESIWRFSHLPENFWGCKVSKIPDFPYKKTVEEWVLGFRKKYNKGKGLYIYGEYGHGKSALAAILLKTSIANQIPALWLNFKELQKISINEDKTMFNPDVSMLERAQNVEFLVIDEVQVRSNLHWPLGVLDDLVRYRFQNKRMTILTSNVTPNTLKTTEMTMSLASILKEAVDILRVKGKNFRDNN